MKSIKKVIIVSPDRDDYRTEMISELLKSEKWLIGEMIKGEMFLASSDKFKEHVAWLMYSNLLRYVSPEKASLQLEDDLGFSSAKKNVGVKNLDTLFNQEAQTIMMFCETKYIRELSVCFQTQGWHIIFVPNLKCTE